MPAQRCSKRFYFLLILLVIGHEFNHVIVANALVDFHGNQVREEKESVDVTQAYNLVVLHKNSSRADSDYDKRDIHVEKRIAPLIAVAIGVSLVSIGVDVLIKVKGCCVFYPSICRNVREFDYKKKVVGHYVKINNQQWKEVNIIKAWVEGSNQYNSAIWVEILRIDMIQELIVKYLGPDVIKKFNDEQFKLKKEIEAQNKTVMEMTYRQLSDRFESPFDNAEDAALRLAGVTGIIGVEISRSAFKNYKLSRLISKTLRTSHGAKLTKAAPAAKKFFGLTKTSTTMHIKQTSHSVFKAQFAGSKYTKFAKGAGRFLTVVSIAVDIYSIIQKIKGCKKVRDQSSRSVNQIRESEREARTLYVDLFKYKYELLVGGFQFLKKELVSDDLNAVLTNFIEMSRASPAEAKDLRSTEPVFEKFMREIKGADPAKMNKLQVELLHGHRKITIYYSCYLTKLQLISYVTSHCKKGNSDMKSLYDQANQIFGSNNKYCITKNGIPYTQYKDVYNLVQGTASVEGFNVDCVMNSEAKKNEACEYKKDGFTAQQTASKMAGLSAAQVEIFYSTCPVTPLTPNEKQSVCRLRNGMKKSDEDIASLLGFKLDQVKAVKC